MSSYRIDLRPGADLAGFRRAVRHLVAQGAPPEAVAWSTGQSDLFGAAATPDAPPVALPRTLASLIETVVCHRDPERYALLYQAVWRILGGERALLDIASDPLTHRLDRMRKAIGRDLHKMHAFLRFRRTETPAGVEHFVAWFEPSHFILDATADFFVDRFRALSWSILTPVGSLHWDREVLTRGPAATRADAPASDPFEAGWSDYYESTFNPARVNPTMMRAEMPLKYWRNMPETQSIRNLIRTADVRAREMIERQAAPSRKRDPSKAVAAMRRTPP